MVDNLIKLLEEKHGQKVNLKEGEVHYLFLKDGLFSVYLDEDTKTVKVNIEFLPEEKTFVYHSEKTLADLGF